MDIATFSKEGHHYFLLVLDYFMNYLWVSPLKYKSQVYDTFLVFHTHVKTQFERSIKSYQCDNGKEFDNGAFRDFCVKWDDFRFLCSNTSSQMENPRGWLEP